MRSESDTRSKDVLVWAALAVLALFGWRTISHTAFWQHLSMGRWIAEHGVPRAEPLTMVSLERPLVQISWLYDWMLYSAWQMGGATLVTLLHVAAVVVAFFFMVQVLRPHANALSVAFALWLCAWLIAPRFEVDPAVFSLVFPALFIFLLSTASSWKLLAAFLLPAQWIWAGMHASFILGPLLIALFAAEIRFRPRSANTAGPSVRSLLLLACAALVVTWLGPYGFGLLGQALRDAVTPQVREWISPYAMSFPNATTKNLITLALALGASGLLTQKQRLPLAITTMAVFSAFLAVRALIVYLEIFALLAFPFLGISFQAIGKAIGNYVSRAHPSRLPAARSGAMALLSVMLLYAAFVLVTNRYYNRSGSLSSLGTGVVEHHLPARATALLTDPLFPAPILHVPMDGGYLSWIRPGQPSFIDHRSTLHGTDTYILLAQALTGNTQSWHAVESTWKPAAIVLNNAWLHAADALRVLLNREDWILLFMDGATTVLIRNTPANAAWLDRKQSFLHEGLQHLEQDRQAFAENLGGWRLPPLPASLIGGANVLQNRGFFREAATLHELVMWGAPTMISAPLQLGICLVQIDQAAPGVRFLQKAYKKTEKNPTLRLMADLHIGMGETRLGRYSEGIRYLQRASRAAPENPIIWIWLYQAFQGSGYSADARAALERAEQLSPGITRVLEEQNRLTP